jgi:hypothetical protein
MSAMNVATKMKTKIARMTVLESRHRLETDSEAGFQATALRPRQSLSDATLTTIRVGKIPDTGGIKSDVGCRIQRRAIPAFADQSV